MGILNKECKNIFEFKTAAKIKNLNLHKDFKLIYNRKDIPFFIFAVSNMQTSLIYLLWRICLYARINIG